jgi:uncharacterized membrane protein YfcA
MNIRLRAAIYTVGMFAGVFAGAFAVVAVANLLGTDAMTVFFVLFGVFLVWTVYELMLGKLKIDENIDAIDKRIEERLKKD